MQRRIIDYGPWIRADRMREKLGGADEMEAAIRSDKIEVFEIEGDRFARWTVWARRPGFKSGWVSVPEMAAHLGLSRRSVLYQIQRGWLEMRYRGEIKEVRRIKDDDDENPGKHRVAIPDRIGGRGEATDVA